MLCLLAVSKYYDSGLLEGILSTLPRGYPFEALFEPTYLFGILIMISGVLALTSIVGILFFKNWARWLIIFSTIASMLFTFIQAPVIYLGWELALWDFANIWYGVIISLLFLPPLSVEFNQRLQSKAEKKRLD